MVSTEPAAPPTQPPVSTSAFRSCLGLAAAVLLWGLLRPHGRVLLGLLALLLVLLVAAVVIARRRRTEPSPLVGPDDPVIGVTALFSCAASAFLSSAEFPGLWAQVGGSAIAALVVAAPILFTVRRRGR